MSDHPLSLALAAVERVAGRKPTRTGRGWLAHCPAHADRRPSLSIAEGKAGPALVKCHAGCTRQAIASALGLTLRDLMPPLISPAPERPSQRASSRSSAAGGQKVFTSAAEAVTELERRNGPRSGWWTYTNAQGNPVGLVVRWEHPDGGKDIRSVSSMPTSWIIGGMPRPRPLYNLSELADGQRVYIVEGEKAADALRVLGLVATTSPHGSKSASAADWSPLAGKECINQPDHDNAGGCYSDDAVALQGKLSPAPTVKRVELPDLPPGGDAIVEEADRCATQ